VIHIKQLPTSLRPREKLKSKGPEALSDFELLQALIGSGNKTAGVETIAKQVKKILQDRGASITFGDLEYIKGLGIAKIAELLAAFELSKRYLIEPTKPIISTADDAIPLLKDIRDKKQEHLVCLTLDGANRLIEMRTITIGTLNSSLVHPREVYADAITDRAASIIISHNHPSGILRPSDHDLEITKRLIETGKILGIPLHDHIIVTKDKFFSFTDNGLLKQNRL